MYTSDPRFANTDIRAKAEMDAVKDELARVQHKAWSTAVTAEKVGQLKEFIDSNTESKRFMLGASHRPKHEALQSILISDSSGKVGPKNGGTLAIHSRARSIFGQNTHNLYQAIEHFRSKIPGGIDSFFKSREIDSNNFVRALHGETINDPLISGFAKDMTKAFSDSWNRFKAAGAEVHTREDFALPHSWNRTAMKAASKETYIADAMSNIDKSRMLAMDGSRLNDQELKDLFAQTYDEIGADKSLPFKPKSGVDTKYQQSRIFHWKNADAYLAMHNKYGSGDPFTNSIKYLDRLSTDTAILETLGPKPDSVMQALTQHVKDSGEKGYYLHSTNTIYDILRGRSAGMNNLAMSEAINTWVGLQVATKLGGAVLSAITHVGFASNEMRLLGGSTSHFFAGLTKALFDGGNTQRVAAELGMPLEYALHNTIAAMRYAEMGGSGRLSAVINRASDAVVRAGGLEHFTQMAQSSYYVEAARTISQKLGTEFEKLDPQFRELLDQYGINKTDWANYKDSMRDFKSSFGKEHLMDITGVKDVDSLEKMHSLLNDSLSYAVPVPSPLTRSITSRGETPSMTAVKRSLFQFHSFTVSSWLGGMTRAFQNPAFGSTTSRALNTAKLATTLMTLGVIRLQLKNLAAGKDLQDWESPALWAEGFLGSGGGGYYAEVINGLNRGQGDPAKLIAGMAGPAIGDAASLLSTVGTAAMVYNKWNDTGEFNSTPLLDKATDNVINFIPGSNLWYTRKAITENIRNGLHTMIDPQQAQDHWKKVQQNLQKDTGQGYWWGNETLPSRMPEVATVPEK